MIMGRLGFTRDERSEEAALMKNGIPKDAILVGILILVGFCGIYLKIPLLAAPLILLLPGYELSIVLFPCKDELDTIERLILSLGLNVSIICMLAHIVNSLGIDLWYTSYAISIVCATAIFTTLSVLRRRHKQNAYKLQLPKHKVSAAFMILVFLLIGAIGVVLDLELDKPVEFYLTDQNGSLNLSPEAGTVNFFVVVANHQGRANYTVSIDGDGYPLKRYNFVLEGESIWKKPLTYDEMNNTSRLDFTLYLNNKTIRRLHLLLRSQA